MQIHWLPKQWPVSASVLLSLPGANVPTAAVCQSGPFWFHFRPHIYSCHTYSGLIYTNRRTPTNISSHLIISVDVLFKGLAIYVNKCSANSSTGESWMSVCWWFQLRRVTELPVMLAIIIILHQRDSAAYSTNNDKNLKRRINRTAVEMSTELDLDL